MKFSHKRLSAGVFAAVMTFSAAPLFAETEKTDAEADAIAIVNGTPISIAERTIVTKQLLARGQQVEEARITEELINLEIMKQEALKLGLDSDPEVVSQLSMLETRILANAAISAIGKELTISDEEIQAEYEKQVSKLDLQEFKASHILLKDEESAKAVITELEGGADFATVAKEKSTGPTGPEGGDLGWFNAQSMVPEFSAAVAAMKKGEISKEPVKTQFGYHVIQLADIREGEKPELEKVRAEIEGILTQSKLAAKLEELRNAADVVIK